MVPERSEMGSRRPLESSLGSVKSIKNRLEVEFGMELGSKPVPTAERRPFWSQNWSKIGQKSIKNRKNIDSTTSFEFDAIF